MAGSNKNATFVIGFNQSYIAHKMKSSQLMKILTTDGWYKVRQSGSHVTMRHDTKKNQLSVPDHGSSEVGKGLERKILKQAQIIGG